MVKKRITDVDYINSLNNNESFFVNQNNTIKQINKGNVVFDVSNGGTGAATASQALDNLGAVNKAGDTMTGKLNIPSAVSITSATYPFVEFKQTADGNVIGSHFYDMANRRHVFRDYASDMDGAATRYCESYYLPPASKGLTENKSYTVLTTKSPIGVTQGGTAATTAAEARANLGITLKNLGLNLPVPVTQGGTGATTAAEARANLGITPANIGALSADGSVSGAKMLDAVKWVSGSLLNFALECDEGVTPFRTQESTTDVPNSNYQYSMGFIFKRSADFIVIEISPYTGIGGTARIVYNKSWGSWRFDLSTVLPSNAYGTSFPSDNLVEGRIFFKKV